jgi:SAM-dependent methyltransferase
VSVDPSSGPVTNPFLTPSVASRYDRARPDLHGAVIARIADSVPRSHLAIDLGCGTGLSTAALSSIASTVVGVDASPAMLAEAVRRFPDGAYAAAAAEALPFRAATFDTATIASALHWFDDAAIDEIGRVLARTAYLIVYDVWFRGEIPGEPGFARWMESASAEHYASVPKHDHGDDLDRIAFEPRLEATLAFDVPMSADELVQYLMTHSERIAAIRDGIETEDEQRRFLTDGIAPFFQGFGVRSMPFGADIQVLARRTDPSAEDVENASSAPTVG